MHGEATFVEGLGVRRVLDAGCGTGRVAIELARRGLDVVGLDADPGMLSAARA
jgi:2-polyprenyl-3-methyl-5-hydroxy-6-metoxy-1,4-benzoquinol methylase